MLRPAFLITIGLAVLIGLFVLLRGYLREPPEVSRYRFGPFAQTGTVISTDISLVRRGTHLLKRNGQALFYLESKTVNLAEFEGKTVNVAGILQANTHEKYLPVLVVDRVSANLQTIAMHQWNVPSLNIAVSAPEEWKAVLKQNEVRFSLEGEVTPILTIGVMAAATMPDGSPIHLAGHTGVRIDHAGNASEVFLLNQKSILRLSFTPEEEDTVTAEEDVLRRKGEFALVLSSLSFLSGAQSSPPFSNSGTTTSPCGGPAGILCPSGSYCDVYDIQANIGKCRRH